MLKQTTLIAKTALTLALSLATGPSRELSLVPLAGIRTALELISKQPGPFGEPGRAPVRATTHLNTRNMDSLARAMPVELVTTNGVLR